MANALNTNSTLTTTSGLNKTSTALSTNIIILVNNTPVGAVQTLTVNEDRSIKEIDEIGTDGHIDSVPQSSTNITGSCTRIRFDRLRITEAFSRGFLHAAAQVYPFDIVILDKQKRDTGSQISTVIKNVWISHLSTTYQISDWTIMDSMNWQAEQIFSVLNGGSATPAAQGGEKGILHLGTGAFGAGTFAGTIEQTVDTGQSRGSLSSSGIIDLALTDTLF